MLTSIHPKQNPRHPRNPLIPNKKAILIPFLCALVARPPAQHLRTSPRLTLTGNAGIVQTMPVVVTDQKRRAWSDAEMEALPKDGHKYELLDGELIMSPVHLNHSLICMRLGRRLGNFVERHNAGETFDSSVGCRLAPDLLLSPDVSFVSKASLAKLNIGPDKFLSGAPDLVVEVLSAGDRMTKINRKLEHYFEHGTKLAWLVNWRKEQIIIYTPDSVESLTRPADILTGGDVLPGFKYKLAEIFRPI
jgi:Uma2 family endonuclease